MFPVLPKLWWKWFKLRISVANVPMAFNIWMSNSSNRKLFPTKVSPMEVVIKYILSISPSSFIYQQTEITQKQLGNTLLTCYRSICIASQLQSESRPPLPFEVWTPAYLVKTARRSHRPASQEGQRTSSVPWLAQYRVKKIVYIRALLWGLPGLANKNLVALSIPHNHLPN